MNDAATTRYDVADLMLLDRMDWDSSISTRRRMIKIALSILYRWETWMPYLDADVMTDRLCVDFYQPKYTSAGQYPPLWWCVGGLGISPDKCDISIIDFDNRWVYGEEFIIDSRFHIDTLMGELKKGFRMMEDR